MKKMKLAAADLRLFDANPNTNVTTDTGLSPEMKEYYSDYLIDNAKPELVHSQFGQERAIPKGKGKTVEFRRYEPLPKATTPLVEGVTPDGKKLSVKTVAATVKQYGDYVTISDMVTMTAIDNNITEATELLGAQAGVTVDSVVREVLNGGTNVQFAEGQVAVRNLLTAEHKLTVKAVKMAVRALKAKNAKKINGAFVGIIHPDVAFDLTNDPEWKAPHQYQDTKELYEGEIGMIAGVRFVESTEAKKWAEAGKNGEDIYSTLILGANAYGVVPLEGGGLEHIFKPLGSAGAADPLNQRSTCGWKTTTTAVRLVEPFMVRIETASTFSDGEAN